jgi:hypothetical protein|tara:strand:- start:444 stop:1274 length:831 start_codon:yes stop_codon:yes gene_type:complete
MITKEENLKAKFKIDYPNSYDLVDIDGLYDSNISYMENYEIIKERFDILEDDLKEKIKEQKSRNNGFDIDKQHFIDKHSDFFKLSNFDKIKTIAIYGDTGTGKTALSFKLLELFKDRAVYFVKYPKPYLLKKFGYNNLNSLEDFERLRNCVVYLDEPQLILKIYDKKANSVIAKLCSLTRQRDIILILSSSDTRVFTRHNESYIDLWLIKDLDYSMVKQRSKIQQIIKENTFISSEGFKLNDNEFVSYSRKMFNYNGRHIFKLIDSWNEELSKPYN